MEAHRFDSLRRALLTSPNRRKVLLGLTSGLVPASLSLHEETAAKKKHKKRKKPATTPPPAGPTCNDGVRNGSETDIDCGGPTCQGCGNGRACSQNTDCSTSRCGDGQGTGDVCRSCSSDGVCGSDANGGCNCNESTGVCISDVEPQLVATCKLCPKRTVCIDFFEGPGCMPLCGA